MILEWLNPSSDDLWMLHRPGVALSGGLDFYGFCGNCGWMGPDRPDPMQAKADAAQHADSPRRNHNPK